MADTQKNPITRGDVPQDDAQANGVPGAHGNETNEDRSGALGVSHTRKDADEIAPTEGLSDD